MYVNTDQILDHVMDDYQIAQMPILQTSRSGNFLQIDKQANRQTNRWTCRIDRNIALPLVHACNIMT